MVNGEAADPMCNILLENRCHGKSLPKVGGSLRVEPNSIFMQQSKTIFQHSCRGRTASARNNKIEKDRNSIFLNRGSYMPTEVCDLNSPGSPVYRGLQSSTRGSKAYG